MSIKISGNNSSGKGFLILFISLIPTIISYYSYKNLLFSLVLFISIFILLEVYLAVRTRLVRSSEVRKMEAVFPDFIELVSSNLRAGMTIDRALLMSSRKEFYPLDIEILRLGKDIMTGREIHLALEDMARRIGSPKIQKTVALIISGLRSGGNVAILLEETANNMRERNFVEKRAASNVLMYIILIAFGVAVGSPILFSLSVVLVGVMSSIIGDAGVDNSSTNLPISLTQSSISVDFIIIYSMLFIFVSCILASLLLGLVGKGDQKEGIKYAPIFIAVSLIIFWFMKTILSNVFSGMF